MNIVLTVAKILSAVFFTCVIFALIQNINVRGVFFLQSFFGLTVYRAYELEQFLELVLTAIASGFVFTLCTRERKMALATLAGGIIVSSLLLLTIIDGRGLIRSNDYFVFYWPLWVFLAYIPGALLGVQSHKRKILDLISNQVKFRLLPTIRKSYFLIALLFLVVILGLRFLSPQIVEIIFLPNIKYKWIDHSVKMYSVYSVYLLTLWVLSLYYVKRRSKSKYVTTLIVFVSWLSFPTFKHWDIECYDYCQKSVGDHSDVFVPIIFSIEHLLFPFAPPFVDIFYLLFSTIIFLVCFLILLKASVINKDQLLRFSEVKAIFFRFCFIHLGLLAIAAIFLFIIMLT